MDLIAIDEALPAVKWHRRFTALWPRYRDWYLRDGPDARPAAGEGRAALQAHMPELVPVLDRVWELAGGDDVARRFLTHYGPPAVITGCSVAVAPGEEPVLVRNYDFSPDFFEGTVLRSRWTGGQGQVIATCEAFMGVLDGINEAGLAVALTFGGRPAHGSGFAIPILLRYVLEQCGTAEEAATALMRLPCASVQNVMILDRAGDYRVVHLSPDREPLCRTVPVTTNHQTRIEWPEAARWNETAERAALLGALREEPGMTAEVFVDAFHRPPLHRTDYRNGLGTFYTAVFRPAHGTVEYRWPGQAVWAQSFESFAEGARCLPIEGCS
jgi:predicted choloylglycine hydrolase